MSFHDEPTEITAKLAYSTTPEDGSKPFTMTNKPHPDSGLKQRNWEFASHEIKIRNLRGKEDSVTLDKNGFQFGVHPSKHKAFVNDADIEAEYYPESVQLLKEVTGASRVVLFDHSTSHYR
jgi:hypothetical protein